MDGLAGVSAWWVGVDWWAVGLRPQLFADNLSKEGVPSGIFFSISDDAEKDQRGMTFFKGSMSITSGMYIPPI